MILHIQHRTHYEYSEAIFPEPSHLYFYPSDRPYLQLLSHNLRVTPEPSGLSPRQDLENNFFYQIWYAASMSTITILMEMSVRVTRHNPLDFLVEYEPKTPHEEAVVPYLKVSEALTPNMKAWIGEIQSSNSDPLAFVTTMAREIGEQWQHTLRYGSALLLIEECFESKKGSCRDLSWMMIQMMRHRGIPARFVSGYAFNPELGEGHELHGWVEIWLRGAGWVGVDPSAGLLTTAYYVPLAASCHPVNTLPVQGTFRGQAHAKLSTSVSISIETSEGD